MKSPSVTTTGMEVSSSAVKIAGRPISLLTTAQMQGEAQRAHPGADNVKRVSPNEKMADNQQNAGMATSAEGGNTSVKQVDHLALEGSNKGDHRGGQVEADPLKGNDNPPRSDMGQYPLRKGETNPPTFKTEDTKGA